MRYLFFLLTFVSSYSFSQEWALKGTMDNHPFHEGLASFYDSSNSKKYGYINSSGEIAIPARYKLAGDFENGMAVVATDNRIKGIIDRNGNYVIQPIYKDIYKDDKVPGLYELHTVDGKQGLFYNGRIVLPVVFKSVYVSNFPFIEFTDQKDNRKIINLVSGDIMDNYSKIGEILIGTNNNKSLYFDATTGERLDSVSLTKSSQDIVLFKDESTNLFGFKNQRTGAVVINPKYKETFLGIWQNDMMIVYDSINSDSPRRCKMIDCYGKEHDLCKSDKGWIYVAGDYAAVRGDNNGINCYALYTKLGEEILPLKYSFFMPLKGEKDWLLTGQDLFDAKNKVFYSGTAAGNKEGMILMINGQTHYYINSETRKRIKGEFFSGSYFNEGLARVSFSNDYHDVGFIDKNGKVVLRGNKQFQLGQYCSEGVIGVYYNGDNYKDTFYGYVYNPLGHKGYNYNKSNKMAASSYFLYNWEDIANKAFENKQYGKAKDYYYKIMMNKPDDTKAILYYGICMNNLGYYDEAIECYQMVLDIDPTEDLAQKNMDIALKNKASKEKEELNKQQQNYESTNSNTFWDALGSFATMLGNFSGAPNTYQQSSSFFSNYNSTNNSGGSDYQSQYDMWARRAESNYNSLTNLGYSVTSKKGKKSGSTLQSMNGGNYVLMKKNLRDAQREMQRIHHQATRNGVSIITSKWETATVNY